jgi:hypothetical protein
MDNLCSDQLLLVMCVEGLLCIPQNMSKSGSERGFFDLQNTVSNT